MIKDLINYEGVVNENFMVRNVIKGIASNGNQYFSFTLQDSSGLIDAKMFSNTESLTPDMFPSGSIVHINGTVSPYKGHSQIKIIDIDSLNNLESFFIFYEKNKISSEILTNIL